MDNIQKYCAQVKRKLPCGTKKKAQLMQTFEKPLNSYLEEHPQPDMYDLIEAFGEPEEMAAVLAESLSEADLTRHNRKSFLLRSSAAVLAAVLLLFSGYVFFEKEKPFEVEGTIEIIDIRETPDHSTGG